MVKIVKKIGYSEKYGEKLADKLFEGSRKRATTTLICLRAIPEPVKGRVQ